jgi:hypothetical protein
MKRKYPEKTHHYIDQHGKPRFYLRRPGHKKILLPGLPWSPEFMAAREAALSGNWGKVDVGAKRTVAGTVNAALVSYYQSTAFTSLAESSKKMRRAILERFRQEHGDKPIALMHKKALQTILNKKSPAAASNWRKALRGFLDHCMSLDMLTADPLAGIKLVPIKSDGHHAWEMEECAKFEAYHPIGMRARLSTSEFDPQRTCLTALTSCGLPLTWFHALRFDYARRVWCLEILDQRLSRIWFFRTCSDAGKENKIGRVLKLRRQRTDKFDPGLANDDRRIHDGNLGLAIGDEVN